MLRKVYDVQRKAIYVYYQNRGPDPIGRKEKKAEKRLKTKKGKVRRDPGREEEVPKRLKNSKRNFHESRHMFPKTRIKVISAV